MTLASRCAELQSTTNTISPDSLTDYTFLKSNTLRDLLATGIFTAETYDDYITQSMGAWIIIAVLALVLYAMLLTNAIWLRRCPQKATGVWECCRLPRNRKHTKPLLGIGLLLCAATLGASIAGAVIGQSNRETGDKAACAMMDFFDRARNGSASHGWGGVTKGTNSYKQIAAKLTTDISAISTTFSVDPTDMNAKKTLYQDDLTMLETTKANYNVKSAKVGSTALIEPNFVGELSPIANAGTHLATLKAESETLADVVLTRAVGLNTEVPDMVSKVTTYQTAATNAANNFDTFGKAITGVSPLLNNYIRDNYGQWENINNGVMVSFYVSIGLTTIIIVTTLFHHKFRSQIALQFAYAAWNFLMLWTVVNAAFAAKMQELKKRSTEHCDVFNLIASDQTYVDKLSNQFTVGFTPSFKSCFFSTGDTYKAVGFGDATDQLGKIATYIREVEPYYLNGPGSKEIVKQKSIIDLYIRGIVPANSDAANDESTVSNLKLFNSLSDSSLAGNKQTSDARCSHSKDMWVLNRTNCTTSLWGAAYGPGDYFGQNICLEILSLDSSSITQRYKDANFADCTAIGGADIADILVGQYNALNTHFEDTRIKLGQLKRFYENNLNFKYNETIRAAASLTQPIQQFNASFSSLLNYVATTDNGILNITNCAFFKPYLLSANTHLCKTGSNVEKTFITHVISVICSAVGCLFVYLYLRKLEGTFRLIKHRDDSGLEELANTPIPPELQNLDALDHVDERKVLSLGHSERDAVNIHSDQDIGENRGLTLGQSNRELDQTEI